MAEPLGREELKHAYELLIQDNVVEITAPLHSEAGGLTTFRFSVPVTIPNPADLPARVTLEARIPAGYPYCKIVFVPVGEDLDGFPHQAAGGLGRELCLLTSPSLYTWDPDRRLREHVDAARGWVAEAANGTLLVRGQPWELPDFRTFLDEPSLLFQESAESFALWGSHVGQVGTVDLAQHRNGKQLVLTKFYREGVEIYAAPWSSTVVGRSTAPAYWILLPSLVYRRHRAPRTYSELADLCAQSGIDFWRLLHKTTKRGAFVRHRYLVVGCPIPKLVEGPAVEVHWQPIAITERRVEAAQRRTTGSADKYMRGRITASFSSDEVSWAPVHNVGGTRLRARGVLSQAAQRRRVCIFGIGAIGSVVAEQLARGGIESLSLFDDETLEFENLTRHTLGPNEVGANKASAIARRLDGIHPNSSVMGYPCRLPPSGGAESVLRAQEAVSRAEVLLDCSANEAVFRWASSLGKRSHQRVIHVFINAHARMLTICSSGRHVSCQRVARLLFDEIDAGLATFPSAEYDSGNVDVEPGAGCWSATFPATGFDIAALVSAAIPVLDRMIATPMKSMGQGIILRRNAVGDPAREQSMVDLAFAREYR